MKINNESVNKRLEEEGIYLNANYGGYYFIKLKDEMIAYATKEHLCNVLQRIYDIETRPFNDGWSAGRYVDNLYKSHILPLMNDAIIECVEGINYEG